MCTTQINEDVPGIRFIKNVLRHDEDVVIHARQGSFESFTLRDALVGMTAGSDVVVGSLLLKEEVSEDFEPDGPWWQISNCLVTDATTGRTYRFHEIPMLVHARAGAWVLALEDEPWAMQEAADSFELLANRLESDGWSRETLPMGMLYVGHDEPQADIVEDAVDAAVGIEELIELGHVVEILAEDRSHHGVLPFLTSLMEAGDWTKLLPELEVALPQRLIRHVRSVYIADAASREADMFAALHQVAEMSAILGEDREVPREIRKLLRRSGNRLEGLIAKYEALRAPHKEG